MTPARHDASHRPTPFGPRYELPPPLGETPFSNPPSNGRDRK